MIELCSKLSIRFVVIRKHFKTKGFIEGGTVTNHRGDEVDLSVLPPFLRTLLVTDGTVTKSLEAYYWEPVAVVSITQDLVDLPARETLFETSVHSQYLHREIQLVGQYTDKVYATADSYICLDKLPSTTAKRLIANQIGIGELLRDEGLESYREIFDFGLSIQPIADGKQPQSVAYRTYVINIDGAIAIEIIELFPIDCYR